MKFRLFAIALLCTGCGGADIVLGLGAPDGGDASIDGGAPEDAEPADGASPSAPRFSEPRALDGIPTGDSTDDDPSLTADLTLLYFNSIREGTLGDDEDILFSTRADADAAWSAPEPATELNTEQRETGIALAPDGLTILWSSDRPGGAGGLDIYMASRASRDAPWSDITRVPELSSSGDDLISALADSGRRALLARRASEDDDYMLFDAERPSTGEAFDEPRPIEELDGDGEESDAFLLANGTALLFTRDGDLYLAQRPASTGTFGEPTLMSDLNSDGDDRDAWASEDFGYVVFSSDRDGEHRLYETQRR